MNDMRTSFKFINIFYQLLGLGKDKKKTTWNLDQTLRAAIKHTWRSFTNRQFRPCDFSRPAFNFGVRHLQHVITKI